MSLRYLRFGNLVMNRLETMYDKHTKQMEYFDAIESLSENPEEFRRRFLNVCMMAARLSVRNDQYPNYNNMLNQLSIIEQSTGKILDIVDDYDTNWRTVNALGRADIDFQTKSSSVLKNEDHSVLFREFHGLILSALLRLNRASTDAIADLKKEKKDFSIRYRRRSADWKIDLAGEIKKLLSEEGIKPNKYRHGAWCNLLSIALVYLDSAMGDPLNLIREYEKREKAKKPRRKSNGVEIRPKKK